MIVSLHLVNFFNLLLMKTSSPISKIHFVKFIYELLVSKYFMDNRLKNIYAHYYRNLFRGRYI